MFWFILMFITFVIGIIISIKENEIINIVLAAFFCFLILLFGVLFNFPNKQEVIQSHTEVLGSEMTAQVDDSPYFTWVDFDNEYHLGNTLTAKVKVLRGDVYITIEKIKYFREANFFSYGYNERFETIYTVEIK